MTNSFSKMILWIMITCLFFNYPIYAYATIEIYPIIKDCRHFAGSHHARISAVEYSKNYFESFMGNSESAVAITLAKNKDLPADSQIVFSEEDMQIGLYLLNSSGKTITFNVYESNSGSCYISSIKLSNS